MARTKSGERRVRKLSQMGGGRSIGITLPIEEIRALGWRERQKVTVTRVRGGFFIRDWQTR